MVGEAGLLFDPDEPTDIAAKMEALLADSNLRKSLISRGFAQSKRFDMDIHAKNVLDVLAGQL